MTTIITRLYSDPTAATAAMSALLRGGRDEDTIHVISADTSGGAAATMKAAQVSPVAAAAYAKAMTAKQALLVVQAPFNPIGTARNAMKILGGHPSIDVGLADENAYVREHATMAMSGKVMSGRQLMMSNPFAVPTHGHILGRNPIMQSKPRTSAIRGGAFMSRAFWPMALVTRSKTSTSAIRGEWLFSKMFGLPLLTRSWSPRDDIPTILR